MVEGGGRKGEKTEGGKKGRSEGKRDSEERRKVKCIPWKLFAAPLGRKALAGGQPTPGPSKGKVTWLSNSPCLEPLARSCCQKQKEGVREGRESNLSSLFFPQDLVSCFPSSFLPGHPSDRRCRGVSHGSWTKRGTMTGAWHWGFRVANRPYRPGWNASPHSKPLP